MAEYFAGGHLRFVNGEWRDDNGNAIEIYRVRHGRWEDKPNPQWGAYDIRYCSACGWSIHKTKLRKSDLNWEYCPNCGCKMDLEG